MVNQEEKKKGGVSKIERHAACDKDLKYLKIDEVLLTLRKFHYCSLLSAFAWQGFYFFFFFNEVQVPVHYLFK